MQDRLVLSRLDQIRALADPLRLRLVAALVPAERSVAGLARLVGAPATRLYHHVELLLAAGLIEERRRVPRRGVEERFYRATARRYTLDGSLLELSPDRDRSLDSLADLARSVLGGALESLTSGLREGRVVPTRRGMGMVLEDRVLRLGADGFAALARELPAWLEEFARRHGRPRGRSYQVAVAAFPAAPGKEERSGRPARRRPLTITEDR